jgi:hypothetical protein
MCATPNVAQEAVLLLQTTRSQSHDFCFHLDVSLPLIWSLSEVLQVLVFFAVAKLGDAPKDGKTDTNPEGLTAAQVRQCLITSSTCYPPFVFMCLCLCPRTSDIVEQRSGI